MTLPVSPNPLSFSQINTEFGYPSNQALSLSNPYLKTMFSDWSNPISMSNGRGKAWPLIHPSVTNVNLFYGTRTGNITVPAGAYRVSIKAYGGGGGGGGGGGTTGISGPGGSGAFVWGIYDVSPGETLSYSVGEGGFGGAGGTSTGAGEGGGGGGATWLRNMSRVDQPYYFIVGGGGGGGGVGDGSLDHGGAGGGGGENGLAGQGAGQNSTASGSTGLSSVGGNGGSQGGGTGAFMQGGTSVSGTNGVAGSGTGTGGADGGGTGGDNYLSSGGGGGGGSGWYGGGGGGWTGNGYGGGGGGGGSTYYQGWLLQLIYLYNGKTGVVGTQPPGSSILWPLYQDANWVTFSAQGGFASETPGQSGGTGGRGMISLEFFTT